jgi:hypothetical protein
MATAPCKYQTRGLVVMVMMMMMMVIGESRG